MSALPDTTQGEPEPDFVVIDTARNGLAAVPRLRNRGGKTAIIVLTVLLLSELAARVLAGGLPDPDWNFAQTDRKVSEMEALAAAGETADVVLLGNSSVNGAFVTEDLEQLTGIGTIFNAALDGSSMRQTEDWALNVVVPLIAPRTVVIGLTSRDLNDASSSKVCICRLTCAVCSLYPQPLSLLISIERSGAPAAMYGGSPGNLFFSLSELITLTL